MRIALALLAPFALGLILIGGAGCVERRGDKVIVSGKNYAVAFSRLNGSILSVQQKGRAGAILKSGEYGLWRVRFQDGSEIKAEDFRADSPDHSFVYQLHPPLPAVRLLYKGPEIVVDVFAYGYKDGVLLWGTIEPKTKTVLEFDLPARLRFDPEQIERFICPMSGGQSVGAAFNASFFQVQPQDRPSGWTRGASGGPKGYTGLYGTPLDQRPDRDPPVALTVTDEGRKWLGAETVKRITGAKAAVNRPPARTQADLTLVDSVNGPYFSASHLGGRGLVWRVGGGVGESEKENVAQMVGGAMAKLTGSATPARNKVGLVRLPRGPEKGAWAGVKVTEWLDRMSSLSGVRFVELASPQEMMGALGADDFLLILNPYGEWTPVAEDGGMGRTVEAIGRYVRSGGNWFEVGGYPFFYEMRPIRYLKYATSYPDGFADFFHLDARSGSASIFGSQPQNEPPWEGAKDKTRIFVPGRLACGGDEQGGYCDRPFGTFVPAGGSWRSPSVHLTLGDTAAQGLKAYCEANAIQRRLEDKMRPEVLDKFKKSVLVYYMGNCKDKIKNLEYLPVPTQIHFADYLKGGFDKEYPDHLPPHPSFGVPEDLRAFFDRSHRLGHLVVPYTNPTWWCDHPKGPTFEREGEAPLLKTLEGKLSYERYSANDGYTVCHWHPAVQAANRETVRQFTEQYPVDVLFQDQCGARGWRYDLNPASPTPWAYSDGLISMVAEDCRRVPLSTENGWDRVVNCEAQLCGMTWSIVPTEGGPVWRRFMKEDYPPETWTVFPLAQYIAHDKTAMIHHDLGQFVTNREVLSWTLGLGFCMSYRVSALALEKDRPREWLRWLDRVQKSICAKYVGEPVTAFEHDRSPAGDGVIRATYGKISLVANLDPEPRAEAGRDLAGYGFRAAGPGLVAANLKALGGMDFGKDGVSFVAEGDAKRADVWVYAWPEQEVCVELPGGLSGDVSVGVDDAKPANAKIEKGVVRFRLPSRAGAKRVTPPAAVAGKAPRDWPGERPAVGVLDFGAGVKANGTRITPQEWLRAFQDSRLAKEFGVSVRGISSVPELETALKAGPAKWLAIINPYGESFPSKGPGQWRETLALIQDYVNNGGSWWETGAYSFYRAFWPGSGDWPSESVGMSGLGSFGLSAKGGAVEQPVERLTVSPEGRVWLGEALCATVARGMSAVNRALPTSNDAPAHMALLVGRSGDFVGGYRLDGWGWLWRIGGFYPNPEVALPVAVAAMEYIYTHPLLPAISGGTKYLWHATVQGK